MGIERFFSAINKNFNVIDNIKDYSKLTCNVLLIDFNSIIHNISSKLISKLNKKNDLLTKDRLVDDLEELIIIEVKNYIDELIEKVTCNLVYIAMDGVPTFSKILEQKKRRFIGELIEELIGKYSLPFTFNKNVISPGTKFMRKMSDYLNKSKFSVKIKISDTDETGEGEFKILDYVLNNNLKDIIIYSPDADLIILAMIIWSEDSKIKILRYDQNTDILNIIHINQLVDYLLFYYEEKINKKIDQKKYILDLCFIFTVFGNDFLPKIENININMDLYLILDGYIINYVDYDYILNDKLDIIPQSFHNYLQFIGKYEKYSLRRNAESYKYQNYNYVSTINIYLDIKNKKYNPAEIFYFDFGVDLDKNDKYGKVGYYKMTNITTLSYEFKNNFNKKYIDDHVKYQKFVPFDYKSNSKKHIIFMKDMNPREKELYLINNKLDKYYYLFNPNNLFYDYILIKGIDKDKYYGKYDVKNIVGEYLKGLKWIINYYFKRQFIDESWHFPFHIAPLISDLILYFNVTKLNHIFIDKKLNISSIGQLLYITPIRITNINKFIDILDITKEEKINIIHFIDTKPYLFYNLDEIYISLKNGNLKKDLMDCSHSNFITKCNYFILDTIQPISQFVSL